MSIFFSLVDVDKVVFVFNTAILVFVDHFRFIFM